MLKRAGDQLALQVDRQKARAGVDDFVTGHGGLLALYLHPGSTFLTARRSRYDEFFYSLVMRLCMRNAGQRERWRPFVACSCLA